MNSFTLNMIGSTALLIALAAVSFLISFYTYRFTVPPINRAKKGFLIGLRGLAISLILFALFQPVFTALRTVAISPSIAALFDDSESMAIQEKGATRKNEYLKSINESKIFENIKNIKSLSFAENFKFFEKFTPDSLKLSGGTTDLSKSLYWISANKDADNIKAGVIFTDGAINSGDNPIYAADNLSIPLYIVGIGDTSEQKDVSVQSIIMNEIGFVETHIPIQANIKASGFANATVKVNFFDNQTNIGSKEIQIKQGQSDYPINFVYNAKEEGIRKISAEIAPLEGEYTSKNNKGSEFIKILKNKKKIALFAGGPSPDVSTVRTFLEQDKSLEIKVYIQKKGSEFYDQTPSAANIKEAEAFVLIGFPINSTPQNMVEQIAEELKNSKPLLFINSLQTDYGKIKPIEPFLPFNIVSARALEYLASPDVKPEFLSNSILRIGGTDDDAKLWNDAPPLFRTEVFTKMKPEAQVAMETKVGQASIKEPLCAVRDIQGQKTVAFLGYGLYRWKLLGSAAEKVRGEKVVDLTEILLNNSIRWLSVNENRKNVKFKTSKKFYSLGEKIEVIAEVYDKSFVPIEQASVKASVHIKGENRELTLNPIGGGKYIAQLDGLASGDYSFDGSAFASNNLIGKDAGRFEVGETPLEYLNTRMNAEFLRTLASRTGGKFYTINEVQNLMQDLKNSKLLGRYIQSEKKRKSNLEFAIFIRNNYALALD